MLAVVGMLGLSSASSLGVAPPFAKANASGKSLAVAPEVASRGVVYHALSERDRQIYFESNAPLENIKGQSNKVIGFAVASTSRDNLVAGEWHLPVTSMKTGIDLRDEHLAGGDWLDAKSHPDIVFQLQKTENVSLEKQSASFSTYSGTLVGDLTMHGVTRPIRVEGARFTFLPASAQTAGVARGDLLAVRAKLSVRLADYGVSHPVIGDKVAETVTIDVALYHSTIGPENQPAK